MTKTFIDICVYCFEFLFFYYYSNSLFKPKYKRKTRIIVTIIAGTLLCVIYQFNITYINLVLLLATLFLMFYFLYNISYKTALFHSFILILVMVVIEMITITFSSVIYKSFNAFENNQRAYMFLILTSKLLYLIIMMIVLKYFAKKENKEEVNKYYWFLFIMPLASILLLISMRYVTYQVKLSRGISWLWIISCTGILLANIVVFLIYEFSLKNQKELYQLKETKRREVQDQQYFKIIEKANNDMRSYAHDMKNHLIQIRNEDDVNEIHAYVDKLIPSFKKFSATGISKNKMLDLILNKYLIICESKNITFDIDVKTANLSYIEDIDLSTLMNNLLDNAVEAAEKFNNGFVQISIFSKNNLYDGLIIKNTCITPPEVKNGILKTKKLDPQLHGIGISSIKKIIKKYNAVYDWKYDKDKKIFETDIAFVKPVE